MCRHLAAIGAAVDPAHLLLDAPNALLRQSWAPRRQTHGVVNADGWGIGWYPSGAPEPLRHRGSGPSWADETFTETARHLQAGCLLASVRSATPGQGQGAAAAMPFRAGRILFSHNGSLDGWPDAAAPLAAATEPRWLLRMDAVTDAALLFALVRQRSAQGAALADAVADTVTTARTVCGGRLNLLLTDGEQVVATAAGASLAVLHRAGSHAVVASEPVDDDPRWTDVAEGCLVVATPSSVRTETL